MSTSESRRGSRLRVVAAAVVGLALAGVAACAQPVAGQGTAASTPAATSNAQPSVSVVTPPPATVYVTPPATVTVPAKPRTPCQQLHADGYSYDVAYTEWARAGYPGNWDADRDGLPCEQSYGEQN